MHASIVEICVNDNPALLAQAFTGHVEQGRFLLGVAASLAAHRCVDWLLNKGVEPNQISCGELPLWKALHARFRHPDLTVKRLWLAGARLGRMIHKRESELTLAYRLRGAPLAGWMLRHGARTRLGDVSGCILVGAELTMDTRIRNCRKVCLLLLKRAPFQQKCLRREWVQHYVWTWRHHACWTPDDKMPEGFE